jgi:hypothetical protein
MIERRHPDPDQLNAFMHGAVNEQEREERLAHLAECAECREIVFLAQAAAPQPPVETMETAPRRRWVLPLALAGTAVAAGLLVALWVRPHLSPERQQHEVAIVKPANPAGPPASAGSPAPQQPAVPPERQNKPSAEPNAAAPHSLPSHKNAPKAPVPGVISGLSGRNPQPVVARAAPPTSQAAPPALTAGTIAGLQSQPLQTQANGDQPRQAPVPEPPATAGAKSRDLAKPSYVLRSESNALHVTVEHDQGPAGEISEVRGTVTDPSGAVVPGATISLENHTSATVVRATAGKDGGFTLAGVAPGEYELRVTAMGFMTESQHIELHAHDLALLTPVLKVGSSSQTVTVTAEPSLLATETAEIAATLPSGVSPTTIVTRDGRKLAVDAAGTLFLSRNAGRHWKKIKPAWSGTVVELGIASVGGSAKNGELHPDRKVEHTPPFQITTSAGEVWVSEDGTHWRLR